MKRDLMKPTLRPDVELRLCILVGGFFLVVLVLLVLSTILWPAY